MDDKQIRTTTTYYRTVLMRRLAQTLILILLYLVVACHAIYTPTSDSASDFDALLHDVYRLLPQRSPILLLLLAHKWANVDTLAQFETFASEKHVHSVEVEV